MTVIGQKNQIMPLMFAFQKPKVPHGSNEKKLIIGLIAVYTTCVHTTEKTNSIYNNNVHDVFFKHTSTEC